MIRALVISLIMMLISCGKAPVAVPADNQNQSNSNTTNNDNMPDHIKISVGGKSLTVAIEDNTATKELVEVLRESSVSYEANDYGGNQLVLFYGTNSWSYTRMGKMEYATLDELKSFLRAGEGKITVTLSL